MKRLATALLVLIGTSFCHADEQPLEISFSNDSEDKFVDVVHYLNALAYNDTTENCDYLPQTLNVQLVVDNQAINVKSIQKSLSYRNYDIPVDPKEKKDLAFILNTLARSSLIHIASSKVRASLNKAGDRIDHLHPLRFLMTIFTSEELKADISVVRNRSWVGSRFYEGIETSLQEESGKNNLLPYQIADFARNVGISVDLITPSIQAKRWKEFVNILVDNIPRQGDTGRYDM